jgi:hypothetical protein
MNECKHEWKEDELFANGGIIMMFGNINDIKQESRFVCKRCGKINYKENRGQEE